MRAACTEPGCEGLVKARGLCMKHYHAARKAGTLAEHELRDRSQARTYGQPDYDAHRRVVDLRLAVEMARSRVAQALIVMQTPEVGALKHVSPGELLDEALQVLDRAAAA